MSWFELVPSDEDNWLKDPPNAVFGCLYYSLLMVTSLTASLRLVGYCRRLAASLAFGMTVYLAYTLTVIDELCVLCWSTHVINALLFLIEVVLGGGIDGEKGKAKVN
jgi:uncharacterized membrane protein